MSVVKPTSEEDLLPVWGTQTKLLLRELQCRDFLRGGIDDLPAADARALRSGRWTGCRVVILFS